MDSWWVPVVVVGSLICLWVLIFIHIARKPPPDMPWERLNIGMSTDDVQQLLGSPKQIIERGPDAQEWRYGLTPFSSVVFFRGGVVTGYKKPL
jgi:hypothetical protein